MSLTLSVIIPVYNTSAYLDAALTSICALGNGCELQIVCVDDGSTDDSLAVLQKWASHDSRIEVLHQDNQGQSVARNTALTHVRGEWVYFFDSDDILLPQPFLSALNKARKSQADMMLFEGEVIDEEGQHVVSNRYHRSEVFDESRLYEGSELVQTLLRTFSFRAVPWLYVVRTDFLRQTGLTFYPGIIHEDELFTATLLLSCQHIGVIHIPVVHHRIRQASTMGAHFTMRNMRCYLTVIDGMQAWLRQHPEKRHDVWTYCRYTLTHVLITARQMPWTDRWKTLRRIVGSGYLPYVEVKRFIQFIAGRWKQPQESHLQTLMHGQ